MRKLAAALILITVLSCNCSKQDEETKQSEDTQASLKKLTQDGIQSLISELQSYQTDPVQPDEIGVIETTLGTIKIKFWTDVAPGHCNNFKRLANFGYYNGCTFHRVIPGFVIQGGDIFTRDDNPDNDGRGGPGYTIPAEFSDRQHVSGVLSMARKGNDINSAGSQFFICVARATNLDGQYTAFGEVIEGMDVVDKIVHVSRDENDRPFTDVVMTNVRVYKP